MGQRQKLGFKSVSHWICAPVGLSQRVLHLIQKFVATLYTLINDHLIILVLSTLDGVYFPAVQWIYFLNNS